MKKNAVLAVITLVAIGVGLFVVSTFERANTANADQKEVERIEREGGARAYALLSEEIAKFSPQEQHRRAHVFGTALYEAEGKSGLSVCDARYSFGCFHEFLGRAIADLGLDSVNELNEGCFSALTTSPLSCQHGIGHGVVSFLGYTRSDLEKALRICRELPKNDPIGGCYGGVFMEYNVRTMLAEQAGPRPIDDGEGLHGPCTSFESHYKAPCYYWQPQWWHQLFKESGEDENTVFARIGKLCTEAEDNAAIRACFEGVGVTAPAAEDFEPARSAELCAIAAQHPRNQLFCLSLAANSLFVGGAGKKGDGAAVCATLVGDSREYCLSYASNASNILNKRELPRTLR